MGGGDTWAKGDGHRVKGGRRNKRGKMASLFSATGLMENALQICYGM